MNKNDLPSYQVDLDRLPDKFPTHLHSSTFWESLGRAVATFGFLEEILGKAIFALTATKTYPELEIQRAYEDWLPQLERALIDPLGNLIDAYGKVARNNPRFVINNLDDLLDKLRKASSVRNILCHGSWGIPNKDGASLPLLVNRQKEIVDTPMDCNYINQVQQHTSELSCIVVETITSNGWKFPGSSCPGKNIW